MNDGGTPFDANAWQIMYHGPLANAPSQCDSFSCGVYAIMCADFFSLGVPVTQRACSHANIDLFRAKVALAILEAV